MSKKASVETDRRGFIRATVAGVVGASTLAIAAKQAIAETPPKAPAPREENPPDPVRTTTAIKLTPTSQKYAKGSALYLKLTPAEQLKEDRRLKSELALRELGDYELVWVKGKTPATRRIVQLHG